MNIFNLLISSSPLANQFGRINISNLAKVCSQKFSEDIYATLIQTGRKTEKNILKVANLEDWQNYFKKISTQKNLVRLEIVNAVNPKWIFVFENYPKKKSLILENLEDYKSYEDFTRKSLTGEIKQSSAISELEPKLKLIDSQNFENTRLYQIYNVLYKSINIVSIGIVFLVVLSLFVQGDWLKIWSNTLLRLILLYGGTAISAQLLGLWLRKYPNLIWQNSGTFNLQKNDNKDFKENDTLDVSTENVIKNLDQLDKDSLEEEITKFNDQHLLKTIWQYLAVISPVVIVAVTIIYYIIFLP